LAKFPLAIAASGVKSAFRRARVKAGYPTVRFHDLRHACASLLIEAGEDLYAVGELLGHANGRPRSATRTLQMERKRAAVNKLGAAVEEKLHQKLHHQEKTLRCL